MSLNEIRPWRNIYRRKSRQIHVGPVPVGGDAPITVQTMTNTDTSDVKATIEQVQRCAAAGADIDTEIGTGDETSEQQWTLPRFEECSVALGSGAAPGGTVP